MTVKTIHDLDAAAALDGTEELELQLAGGGLSKRTTAAALAGLGGRRVTYRDVANADSLVLTTDDGIIVEEGAGVQVLTLPAAPADGEAHPIYGIANALGGTLTLGANGKTIFRQSAGLASAAASLTLIAYAQTQTPTAIYFAARDVWMLNV